MPINHIPRFVLYAVSAIFIWSTLAILGSFTIMVPSFLLVGISLCVSGLISLVKVKEWRVPVRTFLIGVGGIFGYHFLIFLAYKYAPIIEANLLNYLWPLLIVILSPLFLPAYRLRPHHVIGAFIGLSGASLIITEGKLVISGTNLLGYLFAAAAALVWSTYSLLTKRVPSFPTAAIGGFCLVSGVISLIIYFIGAWSSRVYSPSVVEWISMICLGLGPMGSAFFLWDKSLKEGDPRIVGSLSYLTPLLSTLWLIFIGDKQISVVSGLAMALLIFGSIIGSMDLLKKV
jgi:drug/metabolite transporter (DMT)-like permease